jgi:arsenate reductase-like glutaredoxin family protein
VREHLAQAKSPLAKARKGEYLQIKCKDGFVHFIIDKSNYEEHEYVKANAALSDSDKCEPHIQDWIDNQPPTNSELSSHLSTLSGIVGDFIQESRQSQAATSKAMAGLTDALIGLVASTQMLLKILTPKPAPAHEADGELKAVPSYIG